MPPTPSTAESEPKAQNFQIIFKVQEPQFQNVVTYSMKENEFICKTNPTFKDDIKKSTYTTREEVSAIFNVQMWHSLSSKSCKNVEVLNI